MPKVLRIINRFNLGGITYNVSYLSRYLPAEYETMLIGGPEEEGEESSLYIPESMNLKPVLIEEMRRSIHPLSDYFAYRRIKKIIREFKPDIVHTHASKAGAIGRMAALHCRVPVIVHTFHGHVFQGYFGKIKTGIIKSIERYLAKRSSAIIAISNIQKKELTEKHNICAPGKTHVIPLGFDLSRFASGQEKKRENFRKQFFVAENELAIGIIGRLAPIKNHFLFIDAIEYVAANSSRQIKAFIVGDGEMRTELENYVMTKKAARLINFTSWIKKVDEALSGLDIVCLTSRNEGTPVSLIEAQAAGRFVVSTNVGGIKDILHPECGLLSEIENSQQFKENLLKAVKEFDTYSKTALAARNDVMKRFSYERLCNDVHALYQKLLSKP